MAVKLIDLQLIYGVASAREKFEDLVSQLVIREQPDAAKVRIKKGDGGIDVHVGNISDPNGIDVFQCKFFPMGLEDAQKEQIRKSYRTCRNTKKYKTKSWTVCLPVDLSTDEKIWFEEWRVDQTSSGITICDPWGAMKLESLLYHAKNRGLKEAFFKEEHLSQIRNLHHMMTKLLADLVARDLESESNRRDEKRMSEVAKQEEYVSTIVKGVFAKHTALTRLPKMSLSEMQKSRRTGGSHIPEVLGHAMKQCSRFDLVIHPIEDFHKQRFKSINECWTSILGCKSEWENYQIPGPNSLTRETGQDWVGSSNKLDYFADVWRISLNGVFAYTSTSFSDHLKMSNFSHELIQGRRNIKIFPPTLDIEESVGLLTLMFDFARKFTKALSSDGKFHVDITFHNTQSRTLVKSGTPVSLRGTTCCTLPSLSNRWTFSREELEANAK